MLIKGTVFRVIMILSFACGRGTMRLMNFPTGVNGKEF